MSKRMKILLAILAVIVLGFLIPERFRMPVQGASKSDYNQKSFWSYPWGTFEPYLNAMAVHAGVDIFAKKGMPIYSSTWCGLAVRLPSGGKGGNTVLVLGPKWRLHYYAHLDEVSIASIAFVGHNTQLGTVGNTGNAAKTPSHLHYSVATIFPYFWLIDNDAPYGFMKMFFLDPTPQLNGK